MDDRRDEPPVIGASPSVPDAKPSTAAGESGSGSSLQTVGAHQIAAQLSAPDEANALPCHPPRVFTRRWGPSNLSDAIAFVVPMFLGFASQRFPGVVGVGFIVSGWAMALLVTVYILDNLNWPKRFGGAWRAIVFAGVLGVLAFFTSRFFSQSLITVSPSPLPTTAFLGVSQTSPKEAAVLLASALWRSWPKTGESRTTLSQVLATLKDKPPFPTDWPRALPLLEKQGIVKNVQSIPGSKWTYYGRDGRTESFNADYWLTFVPRAVKSPNPH